MFGIGREREKEWAAFEAEALPLMPDVFRVARWLAGDTTLAEDLTQETFAQALKSFHRYSPDTNCRAWLITILYRVNGKRRMKLGQLKLVEDTEEQIAETVAFEPPIPHHLTDEVILRALKRIPQKYCDVVLLTDVEEFSYKEAADLLGTPIGTVMSRLHRGRRLLRQELTDYARNMGYFAKKG
ncbi:MAG: sigma-70 family RNA polymerase sigma factor [Pyrinomonadaceae bacterium]